jgi:uncharacterized protein (DUF433 family)
MNLDRIQTSAPGGMATVRGGLAVSAVVSELGAGHTVEELLTRHPELEREDILQALRYAASVVAEDQPSDAEWQALLASLDEARTEVEQGHGLTLAEHRNRNAERLARLRQP